MSLLLHAMCDLMFYVLQIAVLNAVTGCKYDVHTLHRVLLHRKIPGFYIPSCLGSEMYVNCAFINIEVRFGGCFSAKIGLVSINCLLVSGSFMDLKKFVITSIMWWYYKVG